VGNHRERLAIGLGQVVVTMVRKPEKTTSELWPTTLEQAHAWIGAREPAAPASLAAEKAWRELAAQIYRRVAATDPHWATQARDWARAEEETAFRLGARIEVRRAMAYYLGDASPAGNACPPTGGDVDTS
jgi:hypothetical protein